jgi:hypothetical protein
MVSQPRPDALAVEDMLTARQAQGRVAVAELLLADRALWEQEGGGGGGSGRAVDSDGVNGEQLPCRESLLCPFGGAERGAVEQQEVLIGQLQRVEARGGPGVGRRSSGCLD